MDYKAIRFMTRENIGWIKLARPKERNAINAQMRAELLHCIKSVHKHARVAVIYSGGDDFCAGQDFEDVRRVSEIDMEGPLRDEYQPLLEAIYECRIPVLAAVHGAATGMGASLALSCDVVVAAKSAEFTQAFSRLGMVPAGASSYWLPRHVGFARSMGAVLFGEPVSAEKAEQWGMIWTTTPDDSLMETTADMALKLTNGPTESFRLMKKAMRLSMDQTLEEQFESEAVLQGKAGRTRDFVEGVMAKIDGRDPDFEGR